MKLAPRIASLLLACALLSWAWQSVPTALTRGPYLQSTTATSVIVVCRTSAATSVTLRYGRHAAPPWEEETSSPIGITHVFELADLRPETRYAYELSSRSCTLASGPQLTFRTAPPEQSRAPFRFFAWGDSGTGTSAQLEVAAQMQALRPVPDFALGLGDLVYPDGEWENYDPRLFAPYAGLLRRMTFWTTLGNHEVKTDAGAPYFDAFYLPTQTGAPGHPSDSERYYSFDYGLAHFTCADSESSSSAPGGDMYSWLGDDLDDARARGKRWLFVYMHHPPYSKGTHDSDIDPELITVRENLVPLFESKGVDLVMTGHSHVYERSFLAKDDAILQGDPHEYTKLGSPDGTVYLVTGCGGEVGTGTLDHPLMATSYGHVAGCDVIDVSWAEVRGHFIERDGRTTDLFALHKTADVTPPRIATVEPRAQDRIAVVFDEPVQAGTGASGAENLANYLILPAAAALAATLDSDQRTVELATTPLDTNREYALDVLGVADTAGNGGDRRARFLLARDTSLTESTAVQRGSLWHYFKGSATPPSDWTTPGFDDTSWPEGPAGFGYADGDDATVFGDMRNNYASVYLRIAFDVVDPAQVVGLTLSVSYDDGFVAFLDGTEIARAGVPPGQTNTTLASDPHEAGTFEPFEAGAARCLLRAGTNVLAVEGHNLSLDSPDFSLHPELVLSLDSPGGPPVAIADAPVETANAPALVSFSSAFSHDDDGPLAGARWDFGDGSPVVSGSDALHLYTVPGRFTATLSVVDGDGQEALDQIPIRIHDQGNAPLLSLSASTSEVLPGESVDFDATGSMDPDGGPVYLEWDFGDPASGAADRSTLPAPSHAFAAAGDYTVRLTVVDDEGSATTKTTEILSRAATAPTAAFTASASALDPREIVFTDGSTGDITSWSWDFGDGGAASDPSPSHRYAAPGDYRVSLQVSGPAGSDAADQTVHVDAPGASSGGGGGGGGCSIVPTDKSGPRGDPSLALCLALLLLVVALRRASAGASSGASARA